MILKNWTCSIEIIINKIKIGHKIIIIVSLNFKWIYFIHGILSLFDQETDFILFIYLHSTIMFNQEQIQMLTKLLNESWNGLQASN